MRVPKSEAAATLDPALKSTPRIDASAHPLYAKRKVKMVSDAAIAHALATDATSRRILGKGLEPAAGDLVGVRLNINVLKNQQVPVQTLHQGNRSGGHRNNRGFYRGQVITYRKWVTLRDVYFTVHQGEREKIASGVSSKTPMASADGLFVAARRPNTDGVEIRFNPVDVHLFVDLNNRPVRWAEEVTIYGHRIYARGLIEHYTSATAPEKVGSAPSRVVFTETLKKEPF